MSASIWMPGKQAPMMIRALPGFSILLSLLAILFFRLLGLPAFLAAVGSWWYGRRRRPTLAPQLNRFSLIISCPALALALSSLTAYQPYWIPSRSMEPTLAPGDRIVVDRTFYRDHFPQLGDIMVYDPPPSARETERAVFIKRIAGLPGDRLALVHQRLYRNGAPVEQEPFRSLRYSDALTDATSCFHAGREVHISAGTVFVLGDNSALSYDSRYWGAVPMENLRGNSFGGSGRPRSSVR